MWRSHTCETLVAHLCEDVLMVRLCADGLYKLKIPVQNYKLIWISISNLALSDPLLRL